MNLSANEIDALEYLRRHGGSMVIYETGTSKDVLGSISPGWGLLRKLEKKGLVVISQIDDWSPDASITEAGGKVLDNLPDLG